MLSSLLTQHDHVRSSDRLFSLSLYVFLIYCPRVSKTKGLASKGFLLIPACVDFDLPKTKDFIWKPLVLGFILALLASLMLWRSHALLRR